MQFKVILVNFELHMFRLILITFLAFASQLQAQVGMQQWRIHFSSNNNIGITQTQSAVYMAAVNGVVVYDKASKELSTLTVINGLSDLGISTISSDNNTVFVGYENGNLDIIEGNQITNIPFIKTAELSGNKTIKNISFVGDLVYISTDVGLVVVNKPKSEIKDTYYPYANSEVNDAAVLRDTLWVATNQGIYFAREDAEYLNDYNNWSKFTDLPASLVNAKISDIKAFNQGLVIAYSTDLFDQDSLYFLKNGVLSAYINNPVENINLSLDGDYLMLSQLSSLDIINQNFEREEIIFEYPMGVPRPTGAVIYDGYYWLSDRNFGLVKAVNSFAAESIYSNSPFADRSYRMDIQYGKLVVAGGGLTQNLSNTYSTSGIYIFENETWTSFNSVNSEMISNDRDWDFISAAVNPSNTDEIAFGSHSLGGLKWVKEGDEITDTLTNANSILEKTGSSIALPDMQFDNNGNLWVVNSGLEPLKVFTPDGASYSYSLGSAAKNKYPYRLMIDSKGRKWIAITSVGIVVFDDNGTLDDPSDDQLQTLTASVGSGNLPNTFVKAIAEDVDGEIWIGTEAGLVVLYTPDNVFDGEFGEFDAADILIDYEGTTEALFGTTYISAIAVDGGNRKWIGTSSSGVICISEDGREEIYRFTAENSPLISNNIFDIKINYQTGEVFFATENGLVSFRADATIGDEEFSNVTVFPNPVRPEYAGPITIQGLGYESDVKITDVAGNMVYRGTSNGGTFIWNGQTLHGERAASGVYLVWSASINGKGKEVAKILIVN